MMGKARISTLRALYRDHRREMEMATTLSLARFRVLSLRQRWHGSILPVVIHVRQTKRGERRPPDISRSLCTPAWRLVAIGPAFRA